MNSNRSYTPPIILITSLFFLWGLAYGLPDVLNKHFPETVNITKQPSRLLQGAYVTLVPYAMGWLAQSRSTSFSYITPIFCFVVVFCLRWLI